MPASPPPTPSPRPPAGPSTPPPPPGPRHDGLLDIDGLATYLGVSGEWVRVRVKASAIPLHRFGRLVRFTPDDVAAIVADAFEPPRPAARRDEVAARRSRRAPAA